MGMEGQLGKKPSGVSTNEEGAWRTGLILPRSGWDKEQGPMTTCAPARLPYLPPPFWQPPPPPHLNPMNDQRLTLPCWNGEGGGGRGWSEEITWTAAASQLTERPLGQ